MNKVLNPFHVGLRRRLKVRGSIACGVVAATTTLALLPAVAYADYEQAQSGGVFEHFGTNGEGQQLGNGYAIAVNSSGVGLLAGEAGSFYVVGRNSRVVRYGPGKEGQEPAFREAWGWGVRNEAEEFQRCGPAVEEELKEPANCEPANRFGPEGGEQVGNFTGLGGVAVDQATGDVYVLNTGGNDRKHHLIEIFTATGTPVGEGFGDATREFPAPGESISESPEKLHELNFPEQDSLAVDDTGTVYVTDHDYQNISTPPGEARLMCFEPEIAGSYEDYRYCGQGRDITTSTAQRFTRVSLVDGGRLVASSRERIQEYVLGEGGSPVCNDVVTPGGTRGMTTDPVTGEVFYFSSEDDRMYRLGACDKATGKFEVLQEGVLAQPQTRDIYALAFDPGSVWGALRPSGVLYGVDNEEAGTGDIFVPAVVLAPAVASESVSDTGTSSSVLRAEIDPHGFGTRYLFQYLSEAEYRLALSVAEGEGKSGQAAEDAAFAGAPQAPAGGAAISGGGIGVAVAAVPGLSPGTGYAFRVVATSECEGAGGPPCVTDGQAAFFDTYRVVSGLPDGREFELVSPPFKGNGEVFPPNPGVGSCVECKPPYSNFITVFPMQSTSDGEAVAYMGYPFSTSEGSPVFNSYVSQRGSSGWQTTATSPALLSTRAGATVAYDSSLEEGLILQHPGVNAAAAVTLSPEAPVGFANFYLQRTADPTQLRALVTVRPPNRTEAGFTLEYAGHSADFSRQFFAANDALTQATSVAPAPADPGQVSRDLYEWHEGTLSLLNVLPGNTSAAAGAEFASASPDLHAISSDGSRVFFSVGSTLYVREGGTVTRQLTHSGTFVSASADGSLVLVGDGCLYSLEGESCTDVTSGQGGFTGLLGQSEDLSRIYFVDTKVLPGSGENERDENAQAGEDNLYLWEEGGATRFIAILSANEEGSNDWATAPNRRTAEASSDGQWLTFASRASLTGYDNGGPACNLNGFGERIPGNCDEVFLYDASDGRLTCASCNPTGETPLGKSNLPVINGGSSWPWLGQLRYLTDTGRLYFDSQDRLSPLDVDGSIEDVYEHEPDGVGSCGGSEGCAFLISSGTGSVDSNFLAADRTGKNVFFTTREQLSPADHDESIDLYDAREGGGFAAETETQHRECQGEACQSVVEPPAAMTFASASFQGAGNGMAAAPKPQPRSKKCPKGKVKRSGRCVKKAKARKPMRKARRAAKRGRKG
ncbi:MAG TPA: hypothetical protein VFW38_10920 [Solirubrobacteraceae bacterium]|nr:hypothetical protein [Solirubrobacteraceae bacterium]